MRPLNLIAKKSLFPKLLMIIFICLFVKGFTVLFGNDHLLVSFALLTGLLLYTKFDIGYKQKQAPFVILMAFIYIGISSYITLLNPLLGIVINLFLIFTMIYLFGRQLEYKACLPFILCYIFAQGTPVTSQMLPVRISGLLIGAVIVSIVYYTIHHKKPDTELESLADTIKLIDLTNDRFQFAVRMAIGVAIALFIGDLWNLQKVMWISASVFTLTLPEVHLTGERMKNSLLGTLIGVISFILVFVVLPPHYSLIITLLMSYVYLFVVEYRIQILFMTINVLNASLILFDYQALIPVRLWFIVLGSITVVAISKIDFMPMFIRFRSMRRLPDNLT